MSESAGVSKTEEQVMTSASPTKKRDELETPSISTSSTEIFLLSTVIFISGNLFTSFQLPSEYAAAIIYKLLGRCNEIEMISIIISHPLIGKC